MPASSSRLAFDDCYRMYDRALESKKGTRTLCKTYGQAVHLRMRLHNARMIDRKDNAETYKDELVHPLKGRSAYDNISASIKQDTDGNHWLYLEKIDARQFETEELDDGLDEAGSSDLRTSQGESA